MFSSRYDIGLIKMWFAKDIKKTDDCSVGTIARRFLVDQFRFRYYEDVYSYHLCSLPS